MLRLLPDGAIELRDYPGFFVFDGVIYGPAGKPLKIDSGGRVQVRSIDGKNTRAIATELIASIIPKPEPKEICTTPINPPILLPPSAMDVAALLRDRMPPELRAKIRARYTTPLPIPPPSEYAKYAADYTRLIVT